MKKGIQLLLLITVFNCTTNDYKNKLIGDWYLEKKPEIGLHFSIDSLLIHSIPLRTKQTWRADESNIYLQNITDLNFNQLDEKFLSNHFIYTSSINLDTLRWTSKKDSTKKIYKFIRIKNRFEHFQKVIRLRIDLPKSKKNLLPINIKYNKPHLFIALDHDRLKIKNNNQFLTVEYLRYFVYSLREKIGENEFESKFVFNLLADKNVTELQLDTIKKVLKIAGIKRIFRVFKNESIDYNDNLKWYGMYEK